MIHLINENTALTLDITTLLRPNTVATEISNKTTLKIFSNFQNKSTKVSNTLLTSAQVCKIHIE